MKLLFSVDQGEALRQGIDAPASTVTLDVDPGTLAQEERDLLSSAMRGGHDCTHYSGRPRITLVEPSLDGLHAALAETAVHVASEKAKADAARAKDRINADEIIAKAIRTPMTKRFRANLNGDGTISVDLDGHGSLECVCPGYVSQYTIDDASPEAQAAYADAEKTAAAARTARAEALRPELERLAKEASDKIAARQAANRAEEEAYADLRVRIDKLYPAFAERRDEGYAKRGEEMKLLSGFLRDAAGYGPNWRSFDGWAEVDELTDQQFAQLKEARSHAPDGASVEIGTVYDGTGEWRRATEDDDPDEIDDDNEVLDRRNQELAIVIEWTDASGIEMTVIKRLDDPNDRLSHGDVVGGS